MKKIVVVQCRLGSTRLKRKALLELDEKPILEFVLTSMKQVPALDYYVVTDFSSEADLRPIVEKNGWKLFVGSEFDVLERFCSLLRYIEVNDIYTFPDYIVRATADNPFLFYDAAQSMCTRYEELCGTQKIDYFTWSGLPHGSGVEILNARSLLDSINKTSSPYDHEHVGPALYNHTDNYNCVFEKAPVEYYHPQLRTTIDTFQDYFHAKSIVTNIKKNTDKASLTLPIQSSVIVDMCQNENVGYPILFVPTVEKEKGTGHFRRCVNLASQCCADIYLGKTEKDLNKVLSSLMTLYIGQKKLTKEQIVFGKIPQDYYKFVVLDDFCTSKRKMDFYSTLAPVVTIDDGADSKVLQSASYSLNVIPSFIEHKNINLECTDFIPLPHNHKAECAKNLNDIKDVLISFGGNGNYTLSVKVSNLLKQYFTQNGNSTCNIHVGSDNSTNLSSELYKYDLVVTYYGFTAFEAISAKCKVLTISPSILHSKLSQKTGFVNIPQFLLNEKNISKAMSELFVRENSSFMNSLIENNNHKVMGYEDFSKFLRALSKRQIHFCPLCKNENYKLDPIVNRDQIKTIRKCHSCGLNYISFLNKEKTLYNADYFGAEYKNQYGKTYLEDFELIKQNGIRRHKIVDKAFKKYNKKFTGEKKVLDIGCAYGPYLSAAREYEWRPIGIDICKSATDYINSELKFLAFTQDFKNDFSTDFANFLKTESLQAVTMWFVIEHFEDLQNVLEKVNSVLPKNSVFAFSTPSFSGVSGVKNTEEFYKQSPSDHFSIWSPKIAKKILKDNGFKVVKIVSTGIHPERFPFVKKHNCAENSFAFKFFQFYAKMKKLGDTFEIYCVKK